MKKIIILSICLLLSSCGKDNTQTNTIIATQEIQEEVQTMEEEKEQKQEFVVKNLDLAEYFQEVDGTAVFYTPQKTEYYFNQEKANIPVSPFSTFKIMSTLIGLHEGVVTSCDSEMSYSGSIYWNENWNQQLTLKESFQTSCVWFYHQMINNISELQMEMHLKDMNYGNCDVSEWSGNGTNTVEELNGFWLNSSLKITPKEQVYFLQQVFEEDNNYKASHISLLKEFMETETPHIFGKTGAGNNQSWYVGFFELENDVTYFSVFIESDKKLEKNAKDITMSIIDDWGSLESSAVN